MSRVPVAAGLLILGAACLSGLAAEAKPARRPAPALVLFDRADFHGDSLVLTRDAPKLKPFHFDDRAQSAEVRGGGRWLICEHPDFGGRCIMLTSSDSNLRRVGLANQVSSVRRLR